MITDSIVRNAAKIADLPQPTDKVAAVADLYLQRMARMMASALRKIRGNVDLTALTILAADSATKVREYMEREPLYLENNIRVAAKQPANLSELLLRIAASSGNATRCDYPKLLQSSVQRALKSGDYSAPKCMMAFDKTNDESVKWARTHAAKLVTEISMESRLAIRAVITRAFTEEIPPRAAALLIRESVSLTHLQANAVVNLHQKIITSPGKLLTVGGRAIRVPKNGMPEARLHSILERYSDALLRQRALNIARTETIAAANKGQQLLWKQAQKLGQLPKVIKHEWMAALSERTCPQCSGLSGEVVEVGKNFSFGGSYPPAHPSCRCTTGLVV